MKDKKRKDDVQNNNIEIWIDIRKKNGYINELMKNEKER